MRTVTLSAPGNQLLAEGTDGVFVVRRSVFQVKGSSAPAWNGSIVLKQVVSGSGLAAADFKNIPYTDRSTNSPVAAGTPITTDGIYEVDGNGVDVWAVYTHTAGSAALYVNPMDG